MSDVADSFAVKPQRNQRRGRRRKRCTRDGCERGIGRSKSHCGVVCERIDTEFDRLRALYETAGDPTLSRDAWLALCEVGDTWTGYDIARAELHNDIVSRGLPVPAPA